MGFTFKQIKHIFSLNVLLLLTLVVTGGEPAWGALSAQALQVTDFRGKKVELQRPAQRIVCLIESALSGLYMLGAEKQIIGVSQNIYTGNVFPYYAALDGRIKTRKLPAPGNWDFVNMESLIALQPDLVIIWSQQTEVIANLELRGIPVFGVFIKRKEDIYREIEALGRLTGHEKRAEELVKYTRGEVERFRNRVAAIPKNQKPAVYYMWAQGNLETSCGGSMVNDLIDLSGGVNVCADLQSEHRIVGLEKVMTWNPEMIIMWNNERKDPQQIIDDPQWKSIRAVRTRKVYEFPEVFWCDLWTLKFLYAVKMAAKWTHPEQFKDIDLAREKDSMVQHFYGKRLPGV